jgi:hypothetical protein
MERNDSTGITDLVDEYETSKARGAFPANCCDAVSEL